MVDHISPERVEALRTQIDDFEQEKQRLSADYLQNGVIDEDEQATLERITGKIDRLRAILGENSAAWQDEPDLTEIPAILAAARRAPLNAACMLGGEAGVVLVAHRQKPTEILIRAARDAGATTRGAWGALSVRGKVMLLQCQPDPPSVLIKETRKLLKGHGLNYKVMFVPPSAEMPAVAEPSTGVNMDAAFKGGPDTSVLDVSEDRTLELIAMLDGCDLDDANPGPKLANLLADPSLSDAERMVLVNNATDTWLMAQLPPMIEIEGEEFDAEDTHERGLQALRGLSEAVADDPTLSTIVARSFAGSQEERLMYSNMGGAPRDISDELIRLSIDLDASETIAAFEGREVALGRVAHGLTANRWVGAGDLNDPRNALSLVNNPELNREHISFNEDRRRLLLQAVADGNVDPAAANRLVSTMFAASGHDDVDSADEQQAMGGALARVIAAGRGADPDAPETEELSDRLSGIFSAEGGRELLFDEDIVPDLRNWALVQAAEDPNWTSSALAEGWESPAVAHSFAQSSLDALEGRGTGQRSYEGNALRNTLGQAIGLPATLTPALDEDDPAFYGESEQLDRVQRRIMQFSAGLDPTDANCPDAPEGTLGNVSVVPVTLTSDDFGAASFPVFRVERPDGTVGFVDHDGDAYDTFEEWQSDNELPPALMTYPQGLQLGEPLSGPEDTPSNTTLAHVGRALDWVAMGVGIAAGVALVVGTGGTAAPLIAAGIAGTYSATRAGERLHDASERGRDVSDLSDDQIRADWIDMGASVLSIGGMASARLATTARAGSSMARMGSNAAAGLQLAANAADVASMGNTAITAAMNWENMDEAQRAQALLQIAFQGGMMAASTRASGASLSDGFSFTRLRNQIEFGTPYNIERVQGGADFPEGSMRVRYDTDPDTGQISNVRIEANGRPDPDLLAVHTGVARQVEAASGLRARLRALLGGQDAPAGSAAWEARLEIDKIAAEADLLRSRLETAGPETRGEIDARLRELATASAAEERRLLQFETQGRGWIAAPAQGNEQAASLGWDPAPDGYTYVARPGVEEPYLRRLDGRDDLPQKRVDPYSGRIHDVDPENPISTIDAERGWQAIDDYRDTWELSDSSGGDGTVAVIEIDGDRFFGVNSHNLTDAEKAMSFEWRDRFEQAGLIDGPSDWRAPAVFHAEGHALMQAFRRRGRMPREVTLMVDRPTCGRCHALLPNLMEAMGIEKLNLVQPNGSVWELELH